MHAEGALPVINKPQAHKPFPLLSIYLYLLCPEGTWGVLEELYFGIRSQQMGIVDVICPFYWFQHKCTCTLKGIVHPKIIIIIIILSLFAYPHVVTDLYAFFPVKHKTCILKNIQVPYFNIIKGNECQKSTIIKQSMQYKSVHNEGKENVLHLVSNTYVKFCIQLSNMFLLIGIKLK